MIFLSGFSSSFVFLLLFLLLLKLLPPPPKSAFLSIDFFKSPTFYKDSQIQSMECLCSVPPGAPPLTPHSPDLAPQSPRHLVSGPGRSWGASGHQDPWPWPPGNPGREMGVSLAPSSPGPSPQPPCKSIYLVRASLNSEVMTPGRSSPQALTRPAPANTPISGRLLPQLK